MIALAPDPAPPRRRPAPEGEAQHPAGAGRPETPDPRLRFPPLARHVLSLDRAYVPLFSVVLVTLPFLENFWPSFGGTKTAYRGAMTALGLLFIYQGLLIEMLHWRHGASTRLLSALAYLARAGVAFVAALGVVHFASASLSNHEAMPAMRVFLRDFNWVPTAVMALVVTRRSSTLRVAEGLWAYPFRAVTVLLALVFLIALASCAASYDPRDSFRDFRNDLGGSLVTLLILLGALRDTTDVRRLLSWTLAASVYIVAINAIGLHRFASGTESERVYWLERRIVYSGDYYFAPDRTVLKDFDYRPTFPFDHHNRLSNYAMMTASIGLIVAVWPGLLASQRLWAGGAALGGFLLLAGTMGRGALLAFFGGLILTWLTLFRPRHRSEWIAAACLAVFSVGVFFLLPNRQQKRLELLWDSFIMPVSAKPDYSYGIDQNVARRIGAIKTARAAIAEHRLLGLGYGYHVYEQFSRPYRPEEILLDPQQSEQYQSHAHNNLLQVAAEMGLGALAAYFLVQTAILLILFAAARRARRHGSPFRRVLTLGLALFFMMHLYGMTNYSLRYSLGHFFWLTMGLLVILALRADAEGGGGRDGESRRAA